MTQTHHENSTDTHKNNKRTIMTQKPIHRTVMTQTDQGNDRDTNTSTSRLLHSSSYHSNIQVLRQDNHY